MNKGPNQTSLGLAAPFLSETVVITRVWLRGAERVVIHPKRSSRHVLQAATVLNSVKPKNLCHTSKTNCKHFNAKSGTCMRSQATEPTKEASGKFHAEWQSSPFLAAHEFFSPRTPLLHVNRPQKHRYPWPCYHSFARIIGYSITQEADLA